MIGDRWRALFAKSGERTGTDPLAPHRPQPPPLDKKIQREHVKKSHGLSQFVSSIRDETGLSILDLGGISQSNVSFITDLGHKLHSVDFMRTLDSVCVPEDPVGGPSQRDRMDAFLEQTLAYEAECLDGVLAWDSLEYLSPPLLRATVERLYSILRPGAYMFAFFHTSERAEWVPVYSYRLIDAETLQLTLRTQRQPVQHFNNRGIEKIYQQFESVKFFLTRDELREVIVRR